MDAGRRREIEDKVAAGERLDYADGVDLYATDELAWLGGLAHSVRTARRCTAPTTWRGWAGWPTTYGPRRTATG